MSFGTLYGIGVGPGDPELIPLKAVRILERVAVVYTAASTKNSYSLAKKIVEPHLRRETVLVRLDFSMSLQSEERAKLWERNAARVLDTLKRNLDAAFVTLGDPMTYSTFGYLMKTIKRSEPSVPIVLIPGITSYQAAAASLGQVLVEGEESLTIASGALGSKRMEEILDHSDNIVILKVYRHYKAIIDKLAERGLLSKSTLISRCGLEGESVYRGLEDLPQISPDYLSLLLVKKRDGE
jgi:precorrin-2/cobalt-factor-2 C20-methyltransferase